MAAGQILPVQFADPLQVFPQKSMRDCSGSIVTRSFCPLPSRTMICPRSKSTSLTRRRMHSISRKPLP